MAKVTRKKLPRGVELTVDHVFKPMQDMRTEVTTSNIDTDQREKKYGTFRVSFNIPWVDSKYFFDNRTQGVGEDGLPDSSKDSFDAPFYIPFCLPPLQEHFDASDPRISDGIPTPILTAVGLSFDQSDEPSAILSQWYGKRPTTENATYTGAYPGYQYAFWGDDVTAATSEYPAAANSPRTFVSNPHLGKKTYARDDAYAVELSILEKEQMFFKKDAIANNGEAQFMRPTGEVLSLSFPASNYIAEASRLNPLTVEGINREFNPYKTYIMALKAPKLHDTDNTRREHCALVNLWVTLKFKMELQPRDTGVGGDPDVVAVQNIPEHYGAKGTPTMTITPPAAGDNIRADESSGIVSTEGLESVDETVRNKLRGGYGEFSMAHESDAVKDDSSYEVITVPVGQGFAFNRMSIRDEYPFSPYARGPYYAGQLSAGVSNPFPLGPYVDRRIIPITHPMTIHHVVFAMNYTSDRLPTATDLANNEAGRTSWLNTTEPNGTVAYSVGVGMVSGVRGDGFGYQQVAHASWVNDNDLTLASGQIDTMTMGLRGSSVPNEYKLWSVPLVLKTNNDGVGYYSTYGILGKGLNGKPFFVGEGNTYTHARTKVGEIGGGPGLYAFSGASQGPANGTEQYLEVRFSVDPTNGGANKPYEYNAVSGKVEWQSPAGMSETDIAVGYGGCWVYIIGKKHLT